MRKLLATRVHVDSHVGFMSADTKGKLTQKRDTASKDLISKGYRLIDPVKHLFRKGNCFARIHTINDWRQTKEKKEDCGEGKYILHRHGKRFYSDEIHVSKWVV